MRIEELTGRTSRRIPIWLLAALLAAVQTGDAQTGGKPSGGAQGNVSVTRVVKVFTAENTIAFSIAYSYDFATRASVYVKNLGTVPGRSSFHYLSPEPEIEFRAVAGGELLQKVALRETVVVAAKPPLNVVPHEAEFPPNFRAFTWTSSDSLPERADAVLGRYFSYLPREHQQKTYLATTFTPLRLSGVREGVLAQTALLISFPYGAQAGPYTFHVQSIVREGRSLSDDYRPTSNQAILEAAASFVDRVIAEMKGARRS